MKRDNTKKIAERKAYALNKLGGVCVLCGTTDDLTFDHINNDRGGDSKRLISQLILCRKDRLDKELELCQLLCRRCHGTKSANERDWVEIRLKRNNYSVHGTMSQYNNHGCRCDLCKKAWSDYIRQRKAYAKINRL